MKTDEFKQKLKSIYVRAFNAGIESTRNTNAQLNNYLLAEELMTELGNLYAKMEMDMRWLREIYRDLDALMKEIDAR